MQDCFLLAQLMCLQKKTKEALFLGILFCMPKRFFMQNFFVRRVPKKSPCAHIEINVRLRYCSVLRMSFYKR